MSYATEAQGLLLAAAKQLDELAPAVSSHGEPEETGQLLAAEQKEAEAESLGAALSAAGTPEAMAALAREIEELSNQARQLRQQAEDGLRGRAANGQRNTEVAQEIQGMLVTAVGGTSNGDELVARAASIAAAIGEATGNLNAAAGQAKEREQTHACLGLIQQAQEHCETAAGMATSLSQDIQDYAARL